MPKLKRVFLILGLVLSGGAVFYGIRYFNNRQAAVPPLNVQDVDSSGVAARIDRLSGNVFWRPSLPADFETIQAVALGQGQSRDLQALKESQALNLGQLFRVAAGAGLVVTTSGNWIISMENDGEYVFEDAKTNPARTIRSAYWFVKKGTFRARPYDYDPSRHLLQIRTPEARIFLEKGEIGMKIVEGGRGQVWLTTGRAVVLWKDGRRKELQVRGMDYL